MKKYKLKTVKFVFTPKQIAGRDWKEPCPSSYRFGNKFTETTNKYEYHQHHIPPSDCFQTLHQRFT